MCETGKLIKSLMVLHNIKVGEIADKLGISEPTFRARLKDGNFKKCEMAILIDLLQINNPHEVFFKVPFEV